MQKRLRENWWHFTAIVERDSARGGLEKYAIILYCNFAHLSLKLTASSFRLGAPYQGSDTLNSVLIKVLIKN